jgi:hypothetical protein
LTGDRIVGCRSAFSAGPAFERRSGRNALLCTRLVAAEGEARQGDVGKHAFDGGQHGASTHGA